MVSEHDAERGVQIRPATGGDIEAMRTVEIAAGVLFREVGLDSIADDPPPEPTALRRHLDDGTAWVAERSADRAVVGYLVASIVDGEGHIDQVSVAPEAAGNRIGSRLIDEAIAWALSGGLEAITLTTFTDIAWNGPYYERLGFERVGADEMGAELSAIRSAERDAGIDVAPRCAMRRRLK